MRYLKISRIKERKRERGKETKEEKINIPLFDNSSK